MNKIFHLLITFALTIILVFALSIPQNIFAAELNFKIIPNKIADDRFTMIEVRIDPQSKKMNVVEGVINFSGTATKNLSVQIENGNSVLPLWPTLPQYKADKRAINFIGGIPDGFNKEGLLFMMRLSSPTVGDLNISYTDGSAYLSDGKGTKENVFSKPLQISLNQTSYNDLNKENLFLNQNKYGILILAVMLISLFVFYGFKKNTRE